MGMDALKATVARRFARVGTEDARHLWTCPAEEFATVARPSDTWWKAGEQAYFGEAYREIAARFPRDPANPAITEDELTRREADMICRIAGEHFGPRRPRILDIPCGTGRHASELLRRRYDVVAMDLQEESLRIARASGTTTCAAAEMRHLPVADGAFDLVLNMWNSFGYFLDEADEIEALKEFRRVLRPGGLALVHGDLDAHAALEGRWVQHMKVPLGDGVLFLVRQVFVAALGGLVCLSWVIFPGEEPFQSPAYFLRTWGDADWERHGRAAGFGAARILRPSADGPGAGRREWVVLLEA
ncbi:class I SAM-dependent methyltransferase [Neoroseomonas soli]|uniref:Class I SAM-dependent methyltransferase n=1 Tax=Neoroseomonas soli TaxID=1081025 RepID=A0A9X9WVP8_9PROT|nr:class I SAM-dependent methyltransferase [Neoroseomonas soli]MBR0671227.1 class I SAM-dependent methyltransferase [Neoroseomonas soli]